MKPVNILFLMHSLTFGGAEHQTIDLINELDREKFYVGVAYLNNIEKLKPNIKVKDLFFCDCLKRKGKLDFAILGKIQQIITTYDVQLIVCVEEYTLLYAYLYKLIFKNDTLKITTVIHHTLPLPGIWKQIKKRIYRTIINKTDKVFFVCHNQAQYWQMNNGINKSISTVVYNGIDASYFSPELISLQEKKRLRETLVFSPNDFVVGICARLNPEKCHIDFLNALAQAKKTGLQIKGLLIGDGPECDHIEEAVNQLGLTDDVVLTGFVQDVRPYLAICDCLAITSHYVETFSISALEAMAMEKPLIMTRIGGAEEQVKDGVTGFLYNRGQTDDLAHHLVWLSTNRDKAQEMGNNARTFLLDNFTLHTMTRSYEAQLLQIFS